MRDGPQAYVIVGSHAQPYFVVMLFLTTLVALFALLVLLEHREVPFSIGIHVMFVAVCVEAAMRFRVGSTILEALSCNAGVKAVATRK